MSHVSNPNAAASGIVEFSTAAAEPRHALDLWVSKLDQALVPTSRDSSERHAFTGRAASLAVGEITFTQVHASRQDAYRTAGHVSRSRHAPCFLVTDASNSWHMRQGDRYQLLRAGDLVLIDSAQPYELHFTESVETCVAELPKAWLGRWLAQPDSATARTIARDQGWGQALSALCTQFGKRLELAQAYPAALLSDQLGAMLAACLEPPPLSSSRAGSGRDLLRDAVRLMRAQLDQCGLTAAAVGTQLGVSPRTLHREFAAQDASFAATLRELRLALAAQLLSQQRLSALSVAELGRRCGYADASHFSREFRRAWGVAPSCFRATRLAG